MALRARLGPPRVEQSEWPWHQAKWTAVPASLLLAGERRMEAENYLSSGYAARIAIESRKGGWSSLGALARVWQPNRLKGIQVSKEFGTPFLAATQAFDLRPTPRKWLSLDRTENANERFVTTGDILVTCSGSVGRSTLAYSAHENVLISHDLLRIEPERPETWGWLYAYLRSPTAQAMMIAAQYGQIIKHLEVPHLAALPVLVLRDDLLGSFNDRAKKLLAARNAAYELRVKADEQFAGVIGKVVISEDMETGFERKAADVFAGRRRMEAGFHSPIAHAILRRFHKMRFPVESLGDLAERVWWMTRFKRVFGQEGVPYLSADELFSLNAPITKRVLIEQTENSAEFFVKTGWLVMACSGQIYGLNGSVALMTKRQEGAFLSHDLVRIVPRTERIHPGYLLTALSHPELGRPLVIRHAYGTSIPHLDPADVATIPIVRLGDKVETEIGETRAAAVEMQGQADDIENELALDSERLITKFLTGDTKGLVLVDANGERSKQR